MRIARIDARLVPLPMAEPFVISLGTIYSADNVFVRVESDTGLVGWGEGAPTPFVTGETGTGTLAAVEMMAPALVGLSPFALGEAHRRMDRALTGCGSAKAALDLALHDLAAKAAGVPLGEFLGGGGGEAVEIDMSIGLAEPEAMASAARELAAQGYRELKIKAGAGDAADRAAIDLIRAAAPDARLKVDANQAWTPAQALAMARHYAALDVAALEQPVPAWDLEGLAFVRSRSPVPIMADESCFTPADAQEIVRRGAADVINIKLMKCGGLLPARRINAIARAAGLPTMLGCMLESHLSIAAAAHLAASDPNFIYADLDSFADCDATAIVARPFAFEPPTIQLGGPGIGVDLAW
ncbi:MAG: dipeptide epimerase [Bifidobacteriaceae bacterium]|jgi:L-alanine-DL-glutamate epimerase-like enolase superfamily enzyme|nr:dipeptide epimerase [Bifidobacteriaceae bacterium]